MTRKLKALGLGLVAALALSAVSASAASAENDVIESSSASGITHLTGVGTDHVFKLTDGGDQVFGCATARFEGTFEGSATSSITTAVEYRGTPGEEAPHSQHCEFAGAEATYTMNSCDYLLTGETDANGDAAFHIECTQPGDEITVDRSGCTLHVPPQTPDGGVTYENDEHAIIVNATVENITYTATGFGCAFVGIPSEGHEGDYTGTTTVVGYEDASHENTVDLNIETE